MSLGQRLKEQRESRELTLDQVSRETCIRDDFLEAVEQDDLDKLPGGSTKQIIEAFAQCVGLDAHEIVEEYEDTQRNVDAAEVQPDAAADVEDEPTVVPEVAAVVGEMREALVDGPRREAGLNPKLVATIVAAGLLLVLGFAAWMTMSPSSTQAPIAAPVVNNEAPPIETAPSPQPAAQPEPQTATPVAQNAPALAAPLPVKEAAGTTIDPPQQAAPTPSTTAAHNAALRVSESGVGLRVVKLQLRGQADTFAPGTKVNFWTRVVGGEKGDTIRHRWLHEGQPLTTKALAIGGSHWRTYSNRTVSAEGSWTVQALDAQGNVLAEQDFICARPQS